MSDATETKHDTAEEWAPGAFATPVLFNEQHDHPTVWTYIKVAIVLAIFTILEVSLYYLEPVLGGIVPPLLIALAALKFATVVAFYMHLKYDGRLLTALFSGPFVIALVIVVALMALFYQFGPKVITLASPVGIAQ